jgi:hypothetical protein
MEVRVDNRGYCEVVWEYLSSCRDALIIFLRVAGTVEVLGGVRTRGLEGERPLICKYFNPNWTSEPLAITDASLPVTGRSAVRNRKSVKTAPRGPRRCLKKTYFRPSRQAHPPMVDE